MGGSTNSKASCAANKVVCGIRSRVQSNKGDHMDNLGVVDVAFKCCRINVDGELLLLLK